MPSIIASFTIMRRRLALYSRLELVCQDGGSNSGDENGNVEEYVELAHPSFSLEAWLVHDRLLLWSAIA
jgi:hypothetical protein